ncbi:MAG: C factor, cell signaling protein, partial [Paracoccaceae bacterium]
RPLASVVALHPGTVDTPFTRSYPDHRKTTPAESARALLRVCDGIGPAQNGTFLAYDGSVIPW